ncbi:hypothetical protein F5Y09DRAFT_356649 [Xylaria sp. FL1042]|nr:hypothetical protein F5Y09DRAFT_356649 [Xylaria sp. FL1042]
MNRFRPLRGNAPGATFWLRWSQILNQGTDSSFAPFLGSDEELRQYLADFEGADKEIHVLDLIQKSRIARFNPPTLQILLNSLVDGLPQAIQDEVGLHMGADYADPDTGPVIGQPSWFLQDDARFQITLDLFEKGILPQLDSGNKRFVLWVVDAGTPRSSYYVTIVLCYGPSDPLKPDVFDRVTHWAVIDARAVGQRSEAAERTANRVLNLLPYQAEGAIKHDVWLPPHQGGQGEDFASGLIAYSVVEQLLDRIGTMYCTDFDIEAIFAPFRPWFNPDAVRAEALGRAAMKTMARLNWKGRLGVFPIQPFGDSHSPLGDREDLAPFQTLPIAHMLPKTKTKTEDAESTVDSLFGDDENQSIATQTVNIITSHGTQTHAHGVPNAGIDLRDLAWSPTPSPSPASEPGQGEAEAHGFFDMYYDRKLQDLKKAKLEAEETREMCLEAQAFAEKLEHDVLQAPINNIPTAYAVERLFWLIQRATERARHIKNLRDSLSRRYILELVHSAVVEQLKSEEAWQELDELYIGYENIYGSAERILNRAYAARLEVAPIDELGEPVINNNFEDIEDGGGAGGGDDGDGGIELIPPSTPSGSRSKTPKQRKYTKAATSALDEDGQEAFTVEVNTEMRSWKSRGEKKLPERAERPKKAEPKRAPKKPKKSRR